METILTLTIRFCLTLGHAVGKDGLGAGTGDRVAETEDLTVGKDGPGAGREGHVAETEDLEAETEGHVAEMRKGLVKRERRGRGKADQFL